MQFSRHQLMCYIEIIQGFISNELKIRYRRSVLGFLWSLITPLLTMLIMTTVFSLVFGRPFGEFLLFLFSAFIPWRFFSGAVAAGPGKILTSEALIKRLYLPKLIFPITSTTSGLIDFLLASTVLYIAMIFFVATPSLALLILPYSIIVLYFLVLGITCIMSVIGVFFRDTQHLISIVMQGWFYLTPILYDIKEPRLEALAPYLQYNFMTYFINMFRKPISEGIFPSQLDIFMTTAFALFFAVVGIYIFKKVEHTFVFRL